VYLRVREADLESRESLAEAALTMEPDAIARCLGLSPVSARVLYERGGFLDPAWIRQASEANGVLELRVLEDQMERHIDRDLPLLLGVAGAEYFLLVIVRGDDRSTAPVDVHLVDIHGTANDEALTARIRGQGALVPVRAIFDGAPRGPALPAAALERSGALDCSIAAQMKALAGEPTMDFRSRVTRPATPPDVGAGPMPASPPGE
jgi:hypothetical protein